MKIRVLLADDHRARCRGLRALIEAQPDMAVVGEAGTGEETLQLAEDRAPDVIVLNMAMPEIGAVA